MRRGIQSRHALNTDQHYEVLRDGVQIDAVTLHIIDGTTGLIARGDHDAMETIDLRDWIDEYTVVPTATVPGDAVAGPSDGRLPA